MRIEAEDYLEAAKDRLTDAHRLYSIERYAFSLYAAGLSVESILRAYRAYVNPEFDERHDLQRLLTASAFRNFVTSEEYEKIKSALGIVHPLWQNTYRFASEGRVKRHLIMLKRDRGIRGDFVKENCRIVIKAAAGILKIGVSKWPHP
ncbi:MAG: HEPN domain-containing protein [candidate division KSB1 bacterium]